MKDMSKSLDLESQYMFYLKKIGLKESTMHPTQKIETKRAFFGACGQMLLLFRDVIGEIKDEDKAILQMQDLLNQVEIFWKEQIR